MTARRRKKPAEHTVRAATLALPARLDPPVHPSLTRVECGCGVWLAVPVQVGRRCQVCYRRWRAVTAERERELQQAASWRDLPTLATFQPTNVFHRRLLDMLRRVFDE